MLIFLLSYLARVESFTDKECLAEFETSALATHNMLRVMHGSPKLEIDSKVLGKMAQDYAVELLKLDKLVVKELSGNEKDLGQNIASAKRKEDNYTLRYCSKLGIEFTGSWYDDAGNYNFERSHPVSKSFVHLLWRSTNQVGFGLAWNKNNTKFYGVAFYSPQAIKSNSRSEFKMNVLPPLTNKFRLTHHHMKQSTIRIHAGSWNSHVARGNHSHSIVHVDSIVLDNSSNITNATV